MGHLARALLKRILRLDEAVILLLIAVITNPGAQTRKGEEDTIEPVWAC